MSKTNVPKGYKSLLSLLETETAIKFLKDKFEKELSNALHLTRVSAPLFVYSESGLNDDLNGIERAISFDVPDMENQMVEIVHSLAKWKRDALRRYDLEKFTGLYTDMNAIRRDEELDNIHSIYVDQWDWELIIDAKHRNAKFLKETVEKIYRVLLNVEKETCKEYPILGCSTLPNEIHFITTQELEDKYPSLNAKERENRITKEYGAVFLMKIGGTLNSGSSHDGRAPDYDDWELNGDILVWYEPLHIALEISSMGIRVNDEVLKKQLNISGATERLSFPYHKAIMNHELPLTIGGGIGQSRLCMYFLKKAHIGEVQASLWSQEIIEDCEKSEIPLL